MTGKISRLPRAIRDELHRRLDNGQTQRTLLPWLNSLPQVQAVLKEFFQSEPISKSNLSQYRKRGFRRWQMLQSASEFLSDAASDPPPSAQTSSSSIVDTLVHWISLRFAAAAHTCPAADDPQTELREIRALLADIVALRRGELLSRRITIEQQRLQSQTEQAHDKLELLFWEWTKRPDIQAKLYPDHDPDKLRLDVVRLLDQELLGARNTFPLDPEPPDPACSI